jgi:outer membrane protein
MRKLLFLLATVVASLFLFQCKQNTPSQVTFNPSQANGGKIVWVNLDSLYEKYDLYKDSKTNLEEEYKKAEASFGGKLEAFQKRAADFQRRVVETQQKANELAPVELQKLEAQFGAEQKKLADEEAALAKQRENALGDLDKKMAKLREDLKTKIDQYLEKIAAERGYDYVMIKSSISGGVLYGNKSLDITEEAIKTLNESYKAGK